MRLSLATVIRLVVFDLDHTLWPFGIDQFKFKPPYRKIKEQVVDSEDKPMNPFPEVAQVLNKLHANGYELAVASRTTYPEGAHSLIELFGWNRLIQYRQIYPGSKVSHFANLKLDSGFSYKQMLFFDDEQRNINDTKPLGVTAVLVNGQIGVTLALIDKCLNERQTNSR